MAKFSIDPEERYEFVPTYKGNHKLPEGERVVATCRRLSLSQATGLNNLWGVRRADDSTSLGNRIVCALRSGLRKLSNIEDLEGEPVRVEIGDDDLVTEAYLSRLPNALRSEIAFEILKRETLVEVDLGKSEPQRSSDGDETPAKPTAENA